MHTHELVRRQSLLERLDVHQGHYTVGVIVEHYLHIVLHALDVKDIGGFDLYKLVFTLQYDAVT